MGKFTIIVTTLLAVSGCDSASPKFIGGSVKEVTVEQSRFRVFSQYGGNAIEAHRVSIEPLPSLVLTLDKAYRAIELATGCRVVEGSLRGDRAIILAEVDCLLPR
ncbi:MAG: hypothetical protein COB40_12210 [Marinosulfonomonas sp.]|nr:MAG: hypothetical protein COB40_12210 [Marinosulfonomonas sp.]